MKVTQSITQPTKKASSKAKKATNGKITAKSKARLFSAHKAFSRAAAQVIAEGEPDPEPKPSWTVEAEKREAHNQAPVTITREQLGDLLCSDCAVSNGLDALAGAMGHTARFLDLFADALPGSGGIGDEWSMLFVLEARRLRTIADLCADLPDLPEPDDEQAARGDS